MNREIIHTRPDDLPIVMDLLQQSREMMRANGNHSQWVGYPTEEDILRDIQSGISRLVIENETVVGTFALLTSPEPTYAYIEGCWMDDLSPYGTIHRLARRKEVHGMADTVFSWCEKQCATLRVDTHADNAPMLHILQRHGYTYCGVVFMEDGSPRKAFQKMLYPTLPVSLKDYIYSAILPQYDHFDAAHQRGHALRVMAQSMELASHYPQLDKRMVFAIAAFHDIGLAQGREHHHQASAYLIRHDDHLLEWFSSEQREIMAQAAEDHRASSQQDPRSLYGRIVAEADRDIDPMTIIRRTLQYGNAHYPEMNSQEQLQRALQHLEEKYGRQGYLKLYIPESRNAANLEKLRKLIDDKERLTSTLSQMLTDPQSRF